MHRRIFIYFGINLQFTHLFWMFINIVLRFVAPFSELTVITTSRPPESGVISNIWNSFPCND